ncbi:MAG: hypothetical protein IID44_09490 [Planctomycetes bacterium]|nr:hypothetical protein [Planctomycetota bacterium]
MTISIIVVGYVAITDFYKHPLEILANGVLSSAILCLLVGVIPQAAT